MMDSCRPERIKFRISRALHAFRMLLPNLVVLIGLTLVFQPESAAAHLVGIALILVGAWNL